MFVDDSELQAFADQLETAADRTLDAAESVMEAGVRRIRGTARQMIRGQIRGRYLPHYPNSITHETTRETDAVVGEVGPEIGRRQGGMGRGVEFGSVHTGPRPHMLPAGDAEEPRLADQLAAVAIRVLR